MFWIEYRNNGTLTRYEDDDRETASLLLVAIVLDAHAELIDFSYSLDGALDETLARMESVKIGYPVKEAV